MLTLVLTRHGHTDRSEPDQYLGQRLDVPLSGRGRADAGRLRDRLAGAAFDRVISSPLLRARETAAIAVPSAPVETDDRLKEADYGAWEGTPADELDAAFPVARAAWKEDPASLGAPGGETGLEIAERVDGFLHALAAWGRTRDRSEGAPGSRVLVVGHSTLNRILLAVALGVPVRDYRRRFRQDWLNLTVVELGPDARGLLVLANDVGHLRAPGALPWGDRPLPSRG